MGVLGATIYEFSKVDTRECLLTFWMSCFGLFLDFSASSIPGQPKPIACWEPPAVCLLLALVPL